MSAQGPNRRGGYDYGMTGSYDYGMPGNYDYGAFRSHEDVPEPEWRHRSFGQPYSPGQAEGPHAGKGPKRSDARMKEDAIDRLTDNSWLDASNIEVEVQDCQVTLTGTVGSRQDKRLAEDIVDTVPGVIDVNNQLRITGR